MVEAAAKVLPRGLALALGTALGSLARLLGVRRSVVLANFAYLEIPDADARRILPALYSNMGKYMIELLRARRVPPPHRVHGGELLRRAGTEGALVLLAHFGNFEVLASVFGTLVENLYVIVKPMHNPYVEAWLSRKRSATGVRTFAHQNALRKVFPVLKQKGLLAALVDQNPGADGTPVPFLGKPALTVRAFAGLQVLSKVPLVSAYAILTPDNVYDVVLTEEPTSAEDDIETVQARHNEIIGGWVRKHPEHWFGWFHRRFRPYIDYER